MQLLNHILLLFLPAWLLSIGVNVADIYRKVLEKQTKGHFKLSKIAMDRLESGFTKL